MNRGAYWAGRALDRDEENVAVSAPGDSGVETPTETYAASDEAASDKSSEAVRATVAERVALGLLGLAAILWIGIAGWAGREALVDGIDLVTVARGIALASGPLALIAALVILWQRNGSREAARYADVARGVRAETLALDAVLSLVSRRLADDRDGVAAEADRLLALADNTTGKLREATAGLSQEIATLDARTRELDATAGTARVDMGVLLADLPMAEAQVRALSDALRTAGLSAHERASGLQATLEALGQRAREAEEANAGAANRLAAQAARIASAGEAAAQGIGEAESRLTAGIDGVLARTADAMEATQASIAAQGEAIEALVDRAAVHAEAVATRSAATMRAEVDGLGKEIEAVAALLARQDGASDALIERLRRGLATVDARFAELDETGRARTERLGEALGMLWTHAERTMATLNDGGTAATTLINRTETLRAAVRASLADLEEALPGAIAKLESDVARSRSAIGESTPLVESFGAATEQAATAIDTARRELDARREAVEALADRVLGALALARVEAASLDETVAEADAKANRLADSTSPKLVDALIRVRETAGQAAERARDALGAIVPQSAAALGEAGRRALDAAIGDVVEAQVARVAAAGDQAADRARDAAQTIERQLARIAVTSASVETQIAAGRAEVEEVDRAQLSQRTALLIETLNSTAIDVSRLLAADPGDAAWNAYLKGDRGVFTRRAVRLLDGGEAKVVARRYQEDDGFRAEVNRYVHDFEALLRPILTTRDGSTLAVVLLSSEMGKLYVALAQAIERLRN